ncbi:hypothetical protein BOTBODRAFT_167347 [Botryobasidium botryosum FD-172 SS1]|uniref:Uncharacterized protein n=1 Tax=Botryobasidium botryosum (strain FD-172 SS1) TaxID=930990 RepID=A0A067LXM9_BOTB1|nr:hypothetical protein BOTBODRAFT_167347 [Botryobasidium botryosum FD-172 SS1]
MGVDAGRLVDIKADGDGRMQAFLLMVGKVPPSVIFAPTERLTIPGFRWAPRTLMTSEGVATLLNEAQPAVCTPTGLLSEYEVLRFAETEIDESATHLFKNTAKEQMYQCRVISSAEAVKYTCNAILAHALPWRTEWVVGAAVYITEEEGVGSEHRLVCEFRRRLHLTDIWQQAQKKEPEGPIIDGSSCRCKVRLT